MVTGVDVLARRHGIVRQDTHDEGSAAAVLEEPADREGQVFAFHETAELPLEVGKTGHEGGPTFRASFRLSDETRGARRNALDWLRTKVDFLNEYAWCQ
jgi:hypothetical protein